MTTPPRHRLSLRPFPSLRAIAAALLLSLTGLLAACGGTDTPIVTLASIAVSPAQPTLAAGLTAQFSATGTYSDGSTQDLSSTVTWSSSTASVATISSSGSTSALATAAGAGTTTITATLNGISGQATLTVTAATLVAISVTPASPSIAKGTSQQFAATGVYSDNTHHDLTSMVTWASSATATAPITSTGMATGAGVGVTTIAATMGSVTGTTTLHVTAATLVSMALTTNLSSIVSGTTAQLTATGTYSDNSQQNLTATAVFTSSNPAVATLSGPTSGYEIATGAAAGAVTITAAVGNVAGTTVLTVSSASLVSITVSPAPASIPKGRLQQFTATGTYNNGQTQPLSSATWASSNTATATINSSGLATSVAVGTTTVTASSAGITSNGATLTVTAAVLASIAVTPASASIINGTSILFTATGTYTDGTTQTYTGANANAVTWGSSNSTVASVSNATNSNGLATGASVGTAQITATEPVSGIVSPPAALTVTAAEYVYVANFNDGTVSQYSVATGGVLTALGTAIAAQSGAYALAVGNGGKNLYVTNYNVGSVSQYAIGSTGVLTPLASATVSTGNGSTQPDGISIGPTVAGSNASGYAYVANYGSGQVLQYSISSVDGSLTQVGVPVAAGAGAAAVTIDPTGTLAFVPNYSAGTISEYSIGPAGVLTGTGTIPLAAGSMPDDVTIDPAGQYAYVSIYSTTAGANVIEQYSLQAGLLTNGVATPAGLHPREMTFFTQAGTSYLYVPNSDSDSVSQFAIGGGGALTLPSNGTTTFTAGSAPNSIAIEVTGQYAYVADRGTATLSQFLIGAGGALTLNTAAATVASGGGPTNIVTTTAY